MQPDQDVVTFEGNNLLGQYVAGETEEKKFFATCLRLLQFIHTSGILAIY